MSSMAFPRKKSRTEMAGCTLSIAGASVAVTLEDPLAYLSADLAKLYTGFLSGCARADAFLTVSHDALITYRQRGERPVRLPEKGNQKANGIVRRITSVCKLPDDPLLVAYESGCLAYDGVSKRSHLLLFQPEEPGLYTVSLYRLLFLFISLVLADQGKVMMHGSGIRKAGKGYLFLGESGAGKSTLARFAGEASVLSDDSPVVGRCDGGFCIYASPYSQVNIPSRKSEGYHLSDTELTKLYFLQKSDRLFVVPRQTRSALGEIIKKHIHGFEFMSAESRAAVFDLCYDLCSRVPTYDLHFRKSNEFWSIV